MEDNTKEQNTEEPVDLVDLVEEGSDENAENGDDFKLNAIEDPESDKSRVVQRLTSTMEDPFAPREGKALTWQNVNMNLVSVSIVPTMQVHKKAWIGTVCKSQ